MDLMQNISRHFAKIYAWNNEVSVHVVMSRKQEYNHITRNTNEIFSRKYILYLKYVIQLTIYRIIHW